MAGSDDQSFGGLIFALVVSAILLQLMGLGYRGLRFAANYEITTGAVTECEGSLERTKDQEWYEFEIEVEGVGHPILVIDGAQAREWGWAMFRAPDPEYDWCRLVGQVVTVYQYDKVRAGMVFPEPPEEELGLFGLINGIESGVGVAGIVLTVLLGLVMAGFGVVLLVTTGRELLGRVEKPGRSEGGVVLRYVRFVNSLVLPMISVVLASVLSIIVGVILMKGMLYVETGSNLLTGLILLIGLSMATISPAFILRGVHWLRTSTSELVVFVRNAFALVALVAVVNGFYGFLVETDFSRFNDGGLGAFLLSVASALFG